MSRPLKPIPDVGFTLADSLTCDINKPDFRELEIGSPVSPLRTRPSAIATASSGSSNSSGSRNGTKRSEPARNSNSGEHSGSTESSPTTSSVKPKPGHPRSESGTTQPLIYSGAQSSVNSHPVNVLPAGNICPSGKIPKPNIVQNRSPRTDVLRSGSGNYGHGSIMRGNIGASKHTSGVSGGLGLDMWLKRIMASLDPEEVKSAGNEMYKKGHFIEALSLYDRAIMLSPANPSYRSNRAAALTGLTRIGDAVKECEEAVKMDPNYVRAHQRLASLLLRLGQVEEARKHLCFARDPVELQKFQTIERHLNKCADARSIGDWKGTMRECTAATAAGVDFSPQLVMCKAEAYLKLHQLNDAESTMLNSPTVVPFPKSCSQTRFFGILCEAYPFFVQAQIEMALGRFSNAVAAIEKAALLDNRNREVSMLLKSVRLVGRARERGNELFKSDRFTEACSAYTEGLKLDPSNSVLYCNRAACWFKLGIWDRSIDDSDQALRIQPNYTKALLRRAASNTKLERWLEAVKDYEVLRSQLPNDKEVAESLFHAQVALKKSRGEEVHNLKFGGEVEQVSGLEDFKTAISLRRICVVHFKVASDLQCKQISPVVETLCNRYQSIDFLEVDINECAEVATAENVRIVPTFKIYRNGRRVKEVICPSADMLEHSVRHYNN